MTPEEKMFHYRLVNLGCALNESAGRIFVELRNLRSLQAAVLRQSLLQRIAITGLTLAAGIPAVYQLLPRLATNKKWIYVAVALGIAYIGISAIQFFQGRDQGKIVVPAEAGDPEGIPDFLRTQLSQYIVRWQIAQDILASNPTPEIQERFTRIDEYWEKQIRKVPEKLQKLVKEKKIDAAEETELLGWIPIKIRSQLQPKEAAS